MIHRGSREIKHTQDHALCYVQQTVHLHSNVLIINYQKENYLIKIFKLKVAPKNLPTVA